MGNSGSSSRKSLAGKKDKEGSAKKEFTDKDWEQAVIDERRADAQARAEAARAKREQEGEAPGLAALGSKPNRRRLSAADVDTARLKGDQDGQGLQAPPRRRHSVSGDDHRDRLRASSSSDVGPPEQPGTTTGRRPSPEQPYTGRRSGGEQQARSLSPKVGYAPMKRQVSPYSETSNLSGGEKKKAAARVDAWSRQCSPDQAVAQFAKAFESESDPVSPMQPIRSESQMSGNSHGADLKKPIERRRNSEDWGMATDSIFDYGRGSDYGRGRTSATTILPPASPYGDRRRHNTSPSASPSPSPSRGSKASDAPLPALARLGRTTDQAGDFPLPGVPMQRSRDRASGRAILRGGHSTFSRHVSCPDRDAPYSDAGSSPATSVSPRSRGNWSSRPLRSAEVAMPQQFYASIAVD